MKKYFIYKILVEGDEDEEYNVLDESGKEFDNYNQAREEFDRT